MQAGSLVLLSAGPGDRRVKCGRKEVRILLCSAEP